MAREQPEPPGIPRPHGWKDAELVGRMAALPVSISAHEEPELGVRGLHVRQACEEAQNLSISFDGANYAASDRK